MKRLFILILIATLFTHSMVYAQGFDDVSQDAWYSESVTFVSEKGIMTGKDNKFNPMQTTTRAEYVNALYNSSVDKGTIYNAEFTDVSAANEYFSAIGWAQQKNVTSGVGNGFFAPEDSLTREMAMTFLYRALTVLDIIPETPSENLLLRFNDYSDVSEWAFEGMNTLVNMGIINGTDDGRLNPKGTLNNAEVATMICNMYSLKTADDTEKWKLNLVNINLQDKTISGNGAVFTDNTVAITVGGDYTVTGTLTDGMIHINTAERVKIRLNNAYITTSNGPCIFVEAADKTFITIEDNTKNSLTALNSEDGAIYSKDDLEIKGNGTLNVVSKIGHGIKASDDLNVENGNINIEAYKDGIHINDTCELIDGTITIKATGDGIDSENSIDVSGGKYNITTIGNPETASSKGFSAIGMINITGGDIVLSTKDKAIKSDYSIIISGGSITVSSAEHSLDAKENITINGGDLSLNSGKDAIHIEADDTTASTFEMNGGTVNIKSKDDAIHATTSIKVTKGKMNIDKCFEGFESAKIYIGGGHIFMNAADDGLNATVGAEIDCYDGEATIHITGGKLEIVTNGDAIDSNGDILVDDGEVICHGPGNKIFGFGTLDFVNKAEINGGTFISFTAIGKAFSDTSTQASFNLNLTAEATKGTEVTVTDLKGNEIFVGAAKTSFNCVIVSTPEIVMGNEYNVRVGNNSTVVKQRKIAVKTKL